MNNYTKWRVLVTGGSGFIGTNLIEYLLGHGTTVVNIDIKPPRNPDHTPYYRNLDIRDSDLLKEFFQSFEPTHVVHMAARTDLNGRSLNDYTSNTDAVVSLIEAIQACNTICRIIFASSMLVCRVGYQPKHDQDYSPSTYYGESKVKGEQLVRSAALKNITWIIVRPSSIWGPWFAEPYRNFFNMVINGRFVKFGASYSYKTFGYVGNAVHQIMALMTTSHDNVHGKIFYIGDNPPLNPELWTDEIAKAACVRPPRRVFYGIIRMAAFAGDILSYFGVKAPMTSFRLKNMITDNVVDLDNLYDITGKNAYDLEMGIRETLDWLSLMNKKD